MKIRVQREDGQIETLELCGTWVFRDGEILCRVTHESGSEHFFTPEGYYDGWGSCVVPTGTERAPLVITALEAKRQVE